jgi:hypothetical protein
MRIRDRRAKVLGAGLITLVLGLLIPMGATAAVYRSQLKRIAITNSGGESEGVVRSADGTLHVVYQTHGAGGGLNQGIGSVAINGSGGVGADVQALSNWDVTDQPGLVLLPNGSLEAVFGGNGPGTTGYSGPFGIVSGDGGSSWSAPGDIGSHQDETATGHVTGIFAGGTSWLTAGCCGGTVVQRGFGTGSPTYTVPTAGPVVNLYTTLDAASGELVVGYQGNNTQSYFQGIAPTVQSPEQLPVQNAAKNYLVVAGRDTGPGVYAAYTRDSRHVRLAQYNGRTVAVATAPLAHPAQTLGVATGPDGRIWVMWGDTSQDPRIYLTRSNKAVTRFEPIQHVLSNAALLWNIFGDGRLGPLDLLASETPNVRSGALINGLYYAHVQPVLSTTVRVKHVGKNKFKLIIKVTDAGDPVSGAKVSSAGKSAKTNAHGVAKFTLHGSSRSHRTVKIGALGYQTIKKRTKL